MAGGIPPQENRCTATAKSTKEQCKQPRVLGRTTCKFHGGNSPVGAQRSNLKEAKYSKYMQENLRKRYEGFLGNEALKSLEHELALLTARMSQLTEVEDVDVGRKTFYELYGVWVNIMAAVRDGRRADQVRLFREMNDMFENRDKHETVWTDIERISNTLSRLITVEQKLQEQKQTMITIEQALTILTAMANSVKQESLRYADPTVARHIIDGTTKTYARLIGVDETKAGVLIDLGPGE